ncbi:MAG: hypothetical protein WBQ63_11615, partial [Candidatus Acidiferrales bacterium]
IESGGVDGLNDRQIEEKDLAVLKIRRLAEKRPRIDDVASRQEAAEQPVNMSRRRPLVSTEAIMRFSGSYQATTSCWNRTAADSITRGAVGRLRLTVCQRGTRPQNRPMGH